MRAKIGTAAALLVVGGMLTACGGSTAAATTPTPTNTTPASCLRALDLADRGFALAADGMEALRTRDATALNESDAQFSATTDEYLKTKADCRAGR